MALLKALLADSLRGKRAAERLTQRMTRKREKSA